VGHVTRGRRFSRS